MLKQIFVIVISTFLSQVSTEARHLKEVFHESRNITVKPLVDLGGRFYYFEQNVATSWDEARKFCSDAGLLLVSVETPEENELIIDHIKTIKNQRYWTSGIMTLPTQGTTFGNLQGSQ